MFCASQYSIMVTNGKSEVDMSKATLKIESTTRDKLKKLSTSMDDTFDTIICRLIEEHEDNLKKKK